MQLTLNMRDRINAVVQTQTAEDEVCLVYDRTYVGGEHIEIACDAADCLVAVQFDDAVGEAFCHIRNGHALFPVPSHFNLAGYSPRAFSGGQHCIRARALQPQEQALYRNLALNPYDFEGNDALFPHAFANVKTRGESIFAARNVIDGQKASSDHGFWPYTSWGINRDPAAELTVDFGRDVVADRAVIYLRADFPHDSWWTAATLSFSDGSDLQVALNKTGKGQAFDFPRKNIGWVRLHSLLKAGDESPFPALTQIEIWGNDRLD